MAQPALQTLSLDTRQYPGGVGIWGALPAVYDTTALPVEHGVHVHARKAPGRLKSIDNSYSSVDIQIAGKFTAITEVSATAYAAASILGLRVEALMCPFCATPHVDTERFSVHPHEIHRCNSCLQDFLEPRRSISNPVADAKQQLGTSGAARPTVAGVTGPLKIDQGASAFSGGVQIWASNPAILWTSAKSEAEGIHVHAYKRGHVTPVVDETYHRVIIDDVELEPQMVRIYMVQQSLWHLRGSVVSLACSKCQEPHFDRLAPFSVRPHRNHPCDRCGQLTVSTEAVISNPMVDVLASLYATARRAGIRKNPVAP